MNRNEVVSAFRELKDQGVTQPWERNEQTKKAWELYDAFYKEAVQKSESDSDPKAVILLNQEISLDMMMIDAGFKADQDSIDAILDFLEQDLESAEEAGYKELAEQIKNKISEFEKLAETVTE
jgi:deoxyribodipyrimidine photolyase